MSAHHDGRGKRGRGLRPGLAGHPTRELRRRVVDLLELTHAAERSGVPERMRAATSSPGLRRPPLRPCSSPTPQALRRLEGLAPARRRGVCRSAGGSPQAGRRGGNARKNGGSSRGSSSTRGNRRAWPLDGGALERSPLPARRALRAASRPRASRVTCANPGAANGTRGSAPRRGAGVSEGSSPRAPAAGSLRIVKTRPSTAPASPAGRARGGRGSAVLSRAREGVARGASHGARSSGPRAPREGGAPTVLLALASSSRGSSWRA